MDKYEQWRQLSKEYFKNVTKEQLIKDSVKVGIIIEPIGKLRRGNFRFHKRGGMLPKQLLRIHK